MTKVLVSFDDVLLRRIDRTAKARGLTRSAYLSGLAEQDVQTPTRAELDQRRRAIETLRELARQHPPPPGTPDSTDVIREMRDSR